MNRANPDATGTTIVIAPRDFEAQPRTFQIAKKQTDGGGPKFLFDVSLPPLFDNCPHLGLVFQRYLPAHDVLPDRNARYDRPTTLGVDLRTLWGVTRSLQNQGAAPKAQRRLRELVQQWASAGVLEWYAKLTEQTAAPRDFLQHLHARRKACLAGARWLTLESTSRLAIGLANPVPVENSGVAWQHTYGFPILPGASLKGLARHYLLEEAGQLEPDAPAGPIVGGWGSDLPGLQAITSAGTLPDGPDDAAHGRSIRDLAGLLFGSTDDPTHEGAVCIHDGWPQGDKGWFEVDVLTPHHREYYGADDASSVFASDRDEPVPVHFLVIKPESTFCVPITLTRVGRAWQNTAAAAALNLVCGLLVRALEEWGVGGKTGSGYGRMKKGGAAADT